LVYDSGDCVYIGNLSVAVVGILSSAVAGCMRRIYVIHPPLDVDYGSVPLSL